MLLGDIGCETQKTFKLLKSIIYDAKEKLHHVVSSEAIEVAIHREETITIENDNISPPPMYFDPLESQCKGRKKGVVRFKRHAESKGKK
jgi:hypothetical protein